MKTLLLILFNLLFVSVYAQQQKSLTPARGHYQALSRFSDKGTQEVVDKQKYLFDENVAAKRLLLKPIFLSENTEFKLPEVPANSSEQTRKELNYLLMLQAQRTPLDVSSSLTMARIYYNPRTTPADSNYYTYRKNLFFIGRSIGTWFNPDALPKTAELMARVWRDASYFIWKYKYQYARVRPYVLDSTIQNLEETNWPAYPSGHAANSYINAYLYQELAPEFADVFLKDAYAMAHSREIIGVHYPSDSETSRIFARQFVNQLFENKLFQQEFEIVKNEWKEKASESFVKPVSQPVK